MQHTPEEKERLNALSQTYEKRRRTAEKAIFGNMTDLQNQFLTKSQYSDGFLSLKEVQDFNAALQNGAKPSEYITKQMRWLFQTGYIPANYREALLWSADHIIEHQYSHSYSRRSLRTVDYSVHADTILNLIRSFHNQLDDEITPANALTQHCAEDAVAYMQIHPDQHFGYLPETIAYALDHGDKALTEALIDIINGEGNTDLNHDILYGIMRSHNVEMHEQVCKLLKAAKLQEGLRQAICEAADSGTAEAFRTILQTMIEENMIRFSAVKRAVATWTGIISTDSKDLNRISEKTLNLISEVLDSEEKRQAYLQSEDCMEILLSLWAYGFYEVRDAMHQIELLAESGTHHQVLTACYFLSNLQQPKFAHQIAKTLLLKHSSEYDIIAVSIRYFTPDWRRAWISPYSKEFKTYNAAPDWSFQDYYFQDKNEAERTYSVLSALLEVIPKKELTFSPCIFPWYSAELTRSDILTEMMIIASYLNDQEKIDFLVPMLPQVNSDERFSVMRLVLFYPQTDIQRMALTDALCDKESYTRDKSFQIIQGTTITDAQYRKIEELLRYKSADARANLITLLLKQDDSALYDSVSRLLADKKEEKRTAALDIIMQVCAEEKRTELAQKLRKLAETLELPTDKEQILLAQIIGKHESAEVSGEESLYSDHDEYEPVLKETAYLNECIDAFKRYFPDSQAFSGKKTILKKIKDAVVKQDVCPSYAEALQMLKNLEAKLEEFKTREFSHNGEIFTLNCSSYQFYVHDENNDRRVPFYEDWEKWYDESGCTPELLERMCTVIDGGHPRPELVNKLLGQGFANVVHFNYSHQLRRVLNDLCIYKIQQNTLLLDEMQHVAYAITFWVQHDLPKDDQIIETKNDSYVLYSHFLDAGMLFHRVKALNMTNGHIREVFDLQYLLQTSVKNDSRYKDKISRYHLNVEKLFPKLTDYIRISFSGNLPESVMFRQIFKDSDSLGKALHTLSSINGFVRDAGIQRSKRGGYGYWSARWARNQVDELLITPLKENEAPNDEQQALLNYGADLFDRVISVVLPVELHRGDTETKYSDCIRKTERIYGLNNLISILQALGKDTLDRVTSYYSHSKRTNLSYLLSVCIPNSEDDAEALAAKIKGTDITEQRLIETALYAPEWLPIIAEYLNWDGFISGCYYFMAHMNERFDDRRRAMIAKYTPLTEEELNLGAFDIEWFKSALESLGKKRFSQIYNAAKYISDGTKHSRARKYADAVLGKLDAEKTAAQIADKRNKDLIMAYALIPFADETELCQRYLRIVQYRKEAKQFGPQRSASERKAADIALQNLAMNAGFADVTRLTLRMETKLLDDSKQFFEGITVDEIDAKLDVDANGKVNIEVMKNGKTLKAIPAKYKKNDQIIALNDTKKKLTEQYRRTCDMMEQAMEEENLWHADELLTLMQNPVAAPIIGQLVFAHNGQFGFLKDGALVSAAGEAALLNPDDTLTVAHPFALWKSKVWTDYQAYLYREKIVQPFRQIFRELYVKLPDEIEASRCLRYAGNQIQPAKTVACLKSRRWIADIEDGLQKVFYQENLVATIYAMADWFSPADIEAPTLEYVAFYDRKTGAPKTISEIPDVLFSEVMRDVDMAVSVAHAGGVDPETSHSTVEMRAALLELSIPLLSMKNVTISGHHALIKGERAEYTVHLGSGVTHIKGGTMLNILPVHSQHRGRIFLPFADNDPKTAEILSKILLLSEDKKIKDPAILSQI